MIDFRIYRAGLAIIVIAIATVLLSLESEPGALAEGVPAAGFDAGDARELAELIVKQAPYRTPGSAADLEVADLVEKRFTSIQGGTIARQDFSGEFDGEEVKMRNVILSLPGGSPSTLVVIANRDTARAEGAASSAAATGILLQLAEQLGSSRHNKTILLVSTDGGADGQLGVREFVAAYPQIDDVEAAIVISQPGSNQPTPPFVIGYGIGKERAGARLIATAQRAVTRETNRRADGDPLLTGFVRLALPFPVAEESVLLGDEIDAIGLSSAGERPLPPSRDHIEDFSATTQAEFGRTALSLLLALDATDAAADAKIDSYLTLAGTMIPGWSVSLLALALIIGPLLTMIDAAARSWRREQRFRGTIASAAGAGGMFVVPLVLAYLLSLFGLIPRPSWPADPGRFLFGWEGLVAFALLALSLLMVAIFLVPLAARRSSPQSVAVSAGMIACPALAVVWAVNPYTAILLAPIAHLWLFSGRAAGPPPVRRAARYVALALLPVGAAAIHLASVLNLGYAAPWQALLAIVSAQVNPLISFACCFLVGSLVVVVAASRTAEAAAGPEPAISGSRRRGGAVEPTISVGEASP